MKHTKTLVALCLAISLLLTACNQSGGASTPGNASQPSAAEPGVGKVKETLTAVFSAEPVNLDPQTGNMLAGYTTDTLIFDTLVVRDETGKIQPSLAKSWEIIDDTTVRFYLRDDVTFHDGSKFTAEDVVYTIRRCISLPVTASTFKSFDGENTVAVDEHTVDLKLKTPFAALFNYLSYARAFIVSKAAVESMGEDAYGREPIGTGPFKIVEWNTGTNIRLERNENYWGEKPASKTINLRFIAEAANRAIELETGGADVIFDVATVDARRLSQNANTKLVEGPSYKTSFIAFNLSKPAMQDIRVREALTLSLDVKSMVEAVYEEYASLADSPIAPSLLGYTPVIGHEYNPERAKALLKEAGQEALTIAGRTQQMQDFQSIAEIAQNMWKQAGITADIQVLDKATYADMGNKNGGVELTVTSQTATTGDPDQGLYTWHSSLQSGIFNSQDKDLDALLNDAAAEYDEARRAELYKAAQQYIADNFYGIPVGFPSVLYGTTNFVEGFYCHPGNTPNLAWVTVYEN